MNNRTVCAKATNNSDLWLQSVCFLHKTIDSKKQIEVVPDTNKGVKR